MSTPGLSASPLTAHVPPCVELGEWTPVPLDRPESLDLKLKDIDANRSHQVKQSGILTFHAVGCTGSHADQSATAAVANVMADQVDVPGRHGGDPTAVATAFLYHLGDVVYKHDKETVAEQSPAPPPEKVDFGEMYDAQFHGPYQRFTAPIFAIAGNHDGKDKEPQGPLRKSAIRNFLKNFCSVPEGKHSAGRSSARPASQQPYPYWLLQTPVAHVIGLYTNVNNGGQLDDPMQDEQPQYAWLVKTLKDIGAEADGRAILLALHYPPYSAAANFKERGDPNLGPTPRPAGKKLEPVGALLQRAYREAGCFPDVVLSAHAHLYQRLTYTYADGRQIPYLIAGAGGHAPVERLAHPCDESTPPTGDLEVVLPSGLTLPIGDQVTLAHANDQAFGFLRLTVDQTARQVVGEYFLAYSQPPAAPVSPGVADTFRLDLKQHRLS